MKYYIIAGEASGDLHGSNLIKALQIIDNQAIIRAWGGDMMAETGAEMRKHYRDLAFMGFLEVVKNLRTILGNMAFCKRDILEFQPDAVIFIDYPGFNLRIAKWLYEYKLKNAFKTKLFYYISPQIWAWHTSRVHDIKKNMDKVFCILPFEKDFYKKYNYDVDYIGHPLLDVVKKAKSEQNTLINSENSFAKSKNSLAKDENVLVNSENVLVKSENNLTKAENTDLSSENTEGPLFSEKLENTENYKPVIALLAGSRRQEIEAMLPTMLKVVPHFPDYQFVIAAASAQDLSYFDQFINDAALVIDTNKTVVEHGQAVIRSSKTVSNSIKIVQNKTYDVLKIATAALVKSGTSTLETALFGVPQVVCYKGSAVSFAIAKRVVNIKYISLVNLIMDKEIVKELIQDDFTVENLVLELKKVIENQAIIKKEYNILRGVLGNEGASERAAALMIKYLKA